MSPAATIAPSLFTETTERRISVEEFEQMEFEFPVELVNGRIEQMPPAAPHHGRVCGNIYLLLELWCRASSLGLAYCNDGSMVTDEEQATVRGPDISYITWERLPHRKLPSKALRVAPNLVVEVLSPSDRWDRIEVKLSEYFTVGVQEVWVVSIDERAVWVCQPQSRRRLSEAEELTSPMVIPGFTARVADFFLHV